MVLAMILATSPGEMIRTGVGIPLLTHLGYRALTSMPVGRIPGRPAGTARQRRNLALRARVVALLEEVKSVEAYAQRARRSGLAPSDVAERLREAEGRIMSTAADIVRHTGRTAA